MFSQVVLSLLVGLVSITVDAASRRGGAYAQPTSWVPYPWATELQLNAGTAQGVWKVGLAPNSSLFYVRVSRDPNTPNINYLTITEKDSETCQIQSTGFGREENITRVMVEMRDLEGKRYKMMIRVYDKAQLPSGEYLYSIKGKVTVLTIMLTGVNKTYSYPMTKLSDRTEFPCVPSK